jgi:hypothetical protein
MPTPEGSVNPGISCPTAPSLTTSCNNHYYDNHMGQIPPGFTEQAWEGMRFGAPHGDLSKSSLPNGVDFWWDEFPSNVGNCWFDNTGSDGTAASVTGPGAGSPPEILPSDCASSSGSGDAAKEAVLLDCSMWERGQTAADRPGCDWFTNPPEPGSAAAKRAQRSQERRLQRFLKTAAATRLQERLDAYGETPDEVMAERTAANAEVPASDPAKFGAKPLGPVTAGSVAQLADCSDWKRGTRPQRLATLADIRAHVNLLDGTVLTPALDDERGYRLLQSACGNDFASSFRLYKLYARASAFSFLGRP